MIKQISSDFPNSRFPGYDSRSESAAPKRSFKVSWVVWCKLLLINWLKNCDGNSAGSPKCVASTCAVVCKLGTIPFVEALHNFGYFFEITEFLCASSCWFLVFATFAQWQIQKFWVNGLENLVFENKLMCLLHKEGKYQALVSLMLKFVLAGLDFW